MRTLTAWLLVNYQKKVKELPSVCISAVGTCITKLKPLVDKVKNKKQGGSDRNAPNCKSRLSWCLKFSFWINLNTLVDAQNILVEKKINETKEGRLPKEFAPAKLTNLFVDQFVTWDEVHRKVVPVSYDGYVQTLYKYHIMKLP